MLGHRLPGAERDQRLPQLVGVAAEDEVAETVEDNAAVIILRRLQPVGVRVTADGTKAYVALGPANRVAVVDLSSFEVKDYLLVGQRVWQLAFSPDGAFLYTTNGNSNDISVIDTASDTVTVSVQVGEQPWGVVAVKSE